MHIHQQRRSLTSELIPEIPPSIPSTLRSASMPFASCRSQVYMHFVLLGTSLKDPAGKCDEFLNGQTQQSVGRWKLERKKKEKCEWESRQVRRKPTLYFWA